MIILNIKKLYGIKDGAGEVWSSLSPYLEMTLLFTPPSDPKAAAHILTEVIRERRDSKINVASSWQ
jgi:hypothetical protein